VPIPSTLATRLEKAAIDNGFDEELPRTRDWLAYASTHAPVSAWLTGSEDGRPVVALSRADVAGALDDLSAPAPIALPPGAVAARTVADVPALHRLLRRAFQLANSLPTALLHRFELQTAAMPRATEAERLVVQRVGQDIFRAGLMDYWEGRCAITGLDVQELLRASHIKPWANCETDAERLDVFNGLLLAPHLDAAFDRGFITVNPTGEVVISRDLTREARLALGIGELLRITRLLDGHRAYLQWHSAKVFRRALPPGG
jgi:hypothetical protein